MQEVKKVTKEDEISFYETISWLWKFWGELKLLIILLLILTPVAMWFRSCSPIIMANIFNEFANKNPDTTFIKDQIWLFLIFGIIHFVMYSFLQSLRGNTNFKLENSFRINLFKYLINLDQTFFQKFNTGDLITRIIDDISEKKLAWFACSGIFRFYEAIIKVVQIVFFMFYLSSSLTFTTLLPTLIIMFSFIFISRKTTAYSKRNQKAISEINSFLTNTIDGIKIIKAYNQEKNQEDFFSQVIENQRKKSLELAKTSALIELSYSRISEVIMILVFFIGGYQVIKSEIPLGTLVAFNTYIFMLIWPMVDIGQFFVKGRGAGVSVQRVKELENFDAKIINTLTPSKLETKNIYFEFKNISYSYANTKVLDNISFDVKKGEKIAITGSVGSGKTTFLNFIPRIIDPIEGEVLLNNKNLKEYDLSELRRKIGFVSQTPLLFSNTVKENIIFGRDIDESKLKQALKVAQLEQEVEKFIDGIDTLIGQRGITLSGGQKQRVAIARAIVEKPEILILDDCTSALDTETENKLWNELYNFIPDITVFLVTHRVKTLEKVDKIILLEKGKISDIGTHKELISRSEYYRKIYSSKDETKSKTSIS
ncbi:MAG: ABC transporter ATP-binding protein [Candidatus Sericytochromatia bacterium]